MKWFQLLSSTMCCWFCIEMISVDVVEIIIILAHRLPFSVSINVGRIYNYKSDKHTIHANLNWMLLSSKYEIYIFQMMTSSWSLTNNLKSDSQFILLHILHIYSHGTNIRKQASYHFYRYHLFVVICNILAYVRASQLQSILHSIIKYRCIGKCIYRNIKTNDNLHSSENNDDGTHTI